MPILVTCECGKQLRAKDELAGKRVKCPSCGSALLIEEVEEVAEVAEPRGRPPAGSEARRPKEDDRRGPADAPSFWMSPNVAGAQVFALSDDALFVADLDKDAAKKAQKAIAKGVPAEEVFEESATVIPFDLIDKVHSNTRGRLVEVFWEPAGKGEKKEANLFCADGPARDELMEALEDRLGWKGRVIEVGRLRASLPPLAMIGIFGFATVCFVLAALKPEPGGGPKTVRTNFVGAIFVRVLDVFGPVGVVFLGSPFVLGGIVWLVKMLRNPPAYLTLLPGKKRGKGRD